MHPNSLRHGASGGRRQFDKSSLTPWLLRYASRNPRLLFVPTHTSAPFHIVSSGFGNADTRPAYINYTKYESGVSILSHIIYQCQYLRVTPQMPHKVRAVGSVCKGKCIGCKILPVYLR